MTCCGTQDINASEIPTDVTSLYKEGSMGKIVKMQALIRGFLTRRRMQKLLSSGGALNRPSFNQSQANYENADV